ncbi:cytochrome c peroxidase [Chitinophaga rupis]|uniref:Cytochrome c peroxidase n=2 Tax=Chitinophaga rupis TaxID=573321 RepID=A0A1H7LQI7_9BACT|nr:cytochrome c peroxidase [Chitinophaga rupis]
MPAVARINTTYLQNIRIADSLVMLLDKSILGNAAAPELQEQFKAARIAYKQIEFLSTYLNPGIDKLINGPPVPEVEEEDNQNTVIQPEGFQVIETFLFPVYNGADSSTLQKEVQALHASFKRLLFLSETNVLSDSLIFRALRKELFRVAALGIAGYDSDLAHHSIEETRSVWETISTTLACYNDRLQQAAPLLYERNNALLNSGLHYLNNNTGFDSFNRMEFLRKYANPLSAAILETATCLKVDLSNQYKLPLKAGAHTLFDEDAFDIDAYAADPTDYINKDKVLLGEYLFFDPALSGNGKRSCASCHQPEKAFTDGVAKSTTIDGRRIIKRNTLTLLNAGLQSALFYDARVTYLEDQITDVLTNVDEMDGSVEKGITFIKNNRTYIALFQKAFPASREPVTPYHLQNAIASYIRSLTSLNSPFDRYVRGDTTQLNAKEIRGFNLYMGKAKCATCHFIPLFNGALPPDYTIMESEVLGVPVSLQQRKVDTDKGRYFLHPAAPNEFAFRVPTLRNVALTAPYMHNGVYQTLQEVLDFYNKGGGAGLHIRLSNQTLPADKLNLTTEDQDNIIAFLEKLTDTTVIHKRLK